MGAQSIQTPPTQACKYNVRPNQGRWLIECADEQLGEFEDAAGAIDHACGLARADADHGHVAVVTTETEPQEFHCFVPAHGPLGARTASMPPHLRLLVSH